MLSLYIHIPFCKVKCNYCSFFVTPEDLVEAKKMDVMKQHYTKILHDQITHRKNHFPNEQIKTIYIGGGTPFQLGKDALIELIETLFQTRDCAHLEELTIELNPDPMEATLEFVEELSKRWKHLYRLRFSFGIQSFDDAILQEAGRGYLFDQLPDFFRKLQKIKAAHVCYNADFIAFGKQEGDESTDPFLPRSADHRSFFENLANSMMFDSFSIYTLELFPGAVRYYTEKKEHITKADKDTIYEEFSWLKNTLLEAGYHRYELSNFAHAGKRSIHNMTYRTMQPYLGLGIHASSFLPKEYITDSVAEELGIMSKISEIQGVRFRVPEQRKKLNGGELFADVTILNEKNRLVEELMLKLRTDQYITDRGRYETILEPQRSALITKREEEGYMTKNERGRRLTESGLDLYNTLATDLIVF